MSFDEMGSQGTIHAKRCQAGRMLLGSYASWIVKRGTDSEAAQSMPNVSMLGECCWGVMLVGLSGERLRAGMEDSTT